MNPRHKQRNKEHKAKVKELDALLSVFVRSRDKVCNKCEKQNLLGAAHILPKGHYPQLRWEPLNLMTLCWLPCHESFWHKQVNDAHYWLEQKYPGRLQRLYELAATAARPDLDMLLIAWRDKIERLANG